MGFEHKINFAWQISTLETIFGQDEGVRFQLVLKFHGFYKQSASFSLLQNQEENAGSCPEKLQKMMEKYRKQLRV